MSAFLTIEDGRSVNGSFEKLREYYSLGIRLISLTWNSENCFGYPNSDDAKIMNKGLKPFGKEAIQLMEEAGMIVDVSHLSDGGFYDCLDILKKPFVASHSNSRHICPHKRNLTDDMIKKLAGRGGIAGLNFCPIFLNAAELKKFEEYIKNGDFGLPKPITYSKVEYMVEMLNYMKNKGGEDFVALGSDLDGISGKLDISSTDKFSLLFDALKKAGWTDRQIEKLAYRNALRVIREVIK